MNQAILSCSFQIKKDNQNIGPCMVKNLQRRYKQGKAAKLRGARLGGDVVKLTRLDRIPLFLFDLKDYFSFN